MKRAPRATRSGRHVLGGILRPGRRPVLGAALLGLGLAWAVAGGQGAAAPAAGPPPGQWRAFANADDVLSLAVDGGTLWAGSRAGGLVRWDTAAGTYRQLLRPQQPLAGATVHDIARDGSGALWLATDGGLTRYDDRGTADPADDAWRSYTQASTFGGLPSDDVRAVAVDGDRLWVGTMQVQDPATGAWSGGGLAMLDSKGTPATADDSWAPVATFEATLRRLPDGSTKYGMVSDNVLDLLVTPKGNLWVATAPHRRLENQADPEAPKVWARVHGGLSYRDTRGSADTADDQWVATPCDDIQFTVTCQVQTLALDRQGFVWAGIGGRGVMYLRADDPNIVDEPARRFDVSEGQGGNYVQGIAFGPAEDPALKDTVWMATACVGTCNDRKGGLSVLNHRGTLFSRNDDEWDLGRGAPFTPADGLARDRAQAVAIAGGTVWVATGAEAGVGGGISRLSLANETFGANLRTACGRPDCAVPPSNFITDLDFGRAGTRWAGHVWVATGSRAAAARRFGQGVVDIDTKGSRDLADDSWTQHSAASTDADGKAPWTGLVGDNVLAVALQGDRVWLGSTQTVWNATSKAYQDGGLALFDGSRWTARTVESTRKGQVAGLRSNAVSSLAVGCSGELWVGSGSPWDFSGAGLDVLSPGGGGHDLAADTWTPYSYPELASNNTADIAVDCAGGRVWVGAQHHVAEPVMGSPGGQWIGGGVAVRDLAAGKWSRHDVGNGLQSYGKGSVKGEVLAVAAGPGGSAWAGTYGTKDLDTPALVKKKPYWPAVLNSWGGSAWTNEVFAGAGWVSGIARDPAGRLWVATSRGGLARESSEPEGWRVERTGAGLRVFDGSAWTALDVAGAGLPANDVAVVAVAPDGDIWVGTDGWGLAQYQVGVAPPTATATPDAASPTPTRTPRDTATPTIEATPSPIPGSRTATATPGSGSPTATRTRTATREPGVAEPIYLPFTQQRRAANLPTATRRPSGPSATPRPRTATATAPTPPLTPTATGTSATGTPGAASPTPPPGSASPTAPGSAAPTAIPSGQAPREARRVFAPFVVKPRGR